MFFKSKTELVIQQKCEIWFKKTESQSIKFNYWWLHATLSEIYVKSVAMSISKRCEFDGNAADFTCTWDLGIYIYIYLEPSHDLYFWRSTLEIQAKQGSFGF